MHHIDDIDFFHQNTGTFSLRRKRLGMGHGGVHAARPSIFNLFFLFYPIEKRLTIFNPFPIYVLVQRLFNYYPNYSTRRLHFEEVETPYCS